MRAFLSVPIPRTDQNGSHGGFRAAAKHRAKDKASGLREARKEVDRLETEGYVLPWNAEDLIVEVFWYHPTNSFRDNWNIPGCLKGVLDGIVSAKLIDDDRNLPLPEIIRLVDKDDPRVEIKLTHTLYLEEFEEE